MAKFLALFVPFFVSVSLNFIRSVTGNVVSWNYTYTCQFRNTTIDCQDYSHFITPQNCHSIEFDLSFIMMNHPTSVDLNLMNVQINTSSNLVNQNPNVLPVGSTFVYRASGFPMDVCSGPAIRFAFQVDYMPNIPASSNASSIGTTKQYCYPAFIITPRPTLRPTLPPTLWPTSPPPTPFPTSCWPDNQVCAIGTTCNLCCHKAYNNLGTACGGTCWTRGTLCAMGTTCNLCCNGASGFLFGNCN